MKEKAIQQQFTNNTEYAYARGTKLYIFITEQNIATKLIIFKILVEEFYFLSIDFGLIFFYKTRDEFWGYFSIRVTRLVSCRIYNILSDNL